ncbi:MAG: hypothetical protein IJO29_06445 [Oscillospiraceae bacterium]|nr:hypothetical protein [Oscillospiraceae bacterium]
MANNYTAFDFVESYTPPEIRRKEKLQNVTRTAKYINIAAVCSMFMIAFFILLVFEHPTVSESENRELEKFPKFSFSALLSGEFTSNLSAYFNDTVPFRESLVPFNSNLKSYFGMISPDDDKNKVVFYNAHIISDDDPNEQSSPAQTNSITTAATTVSTAATQITDASGTTPLQSDAQSSALTTTPPVTTTTTAATTTTTPTPEPQDPNVGIMHEGIVVLGDTGIMLYGGSLANAEEYAGYVNAYKADLGDSVNVYSMVIPTAVSYYLPDEFKQYTRSQKGDIDHILQHLNGVVNVDAYSALAAHTDEKIYTRTDHHWAALGAYYAAQEFCKTANVPFLDISEYDRYSVDGYVGTLYTYTNESSLLNNPEEFVYYKPKTENYTTTYYSQSFTNPSVGALFNEGITNKSSLYLTFMRGDSNIVHIKTSVTNGRKLIIFKDSYGNAIPEFLTGSFEEIYVCDMRYFELNSIEFIKQQGITDVLFASCAFSAMSSNADYIEVMRTRQPNQ